MMNKLARISMLFVFGQVTTACSVSAVLDAISSTEQQISILGGNPIDFGRISTAASISEKEIVLQNQGEVDISGVSAAISYSTASLASTPFLFKGGTYPGTGGTCSSSLSAKSSCKVVIEYDPSVAQSDSGTLTFSYSFQGISSSKAVGLSGIGVTPAVLAITDLTNNDFGTVNVGVTSGTKTFTVTNTGGVATSVMEASLTIPFVYAGGAFPGTSGTCGTTIAATSSCTLVINFTPLVTGLATGSTTISYNDGLVSRTVAHAIQGTGSNPNAAPVAAAQSLTVYSAAKAITLAATDANGDALTYSIVGSPSHGALTGTPPNVTYTPTANYIGADTFTFRANDGIANSNTATITIDVQAITFFLRSGADSPAGNDSTGVISDPTHPFLTAQAVVNAALNLSSVAPITINAGVGNFGHIVLTSNFTHNLTWKGVSSAQTIVGNITANGTDGVDGTVAGENGSAGSNGFTITVKSDGNITFGNISSRGGRGGNQGSSSDLGGAGGTGGTITIESNVIVGSVTTDGGSGGTSDPWNSAGGQGGSAGGVMVYGRTAAISSLGGNSDRDGGGSGWAGGSRSYNIIVYSGGQTGDIIAKGGTGPNSAGASYAVKVEAGGTSGNINVDGADSFSGPGVGGSAYIVGTVNGAISAKGGSPTGNFGGTGANGGDVTIESTGNVSNSISVNSGVGRLCSAGSIIMSGHSGALYADGVTAFGTDGTAAGTITVVGTVNGIVSAVGGSASTGGTAAGNGGTVNISGPVAGNIYTDGGNYSGLGIAGNAGAINLNVGASAYNVYARGGTHDGTGGSGGAVAVYSGVSTQTITVSGGNSSNSEGGYSGSITVYSGGVTGDLYADAGNSNSSNPVPTGGLISVETSTSTGNVYARGSTNNQGTNGDGGIVNYSLTSLSYGSATIDVSSGAGGSAYSGVPGTINYTP